MAHWRRDTATGKSRALHSSARRPGQVALVQSLADQGLDDRLPADVEFLGEAFQFFEHGGGEINIHTLDWLHHAAGIGEEARNILAVVRHAGDGFGRCRFFLTSSVLHKVFVLPGLLSIGSPDRITYTKRYNDLVARYGET